MWDRKESPKRLGPADGGVEEVIAAALGVEDLGARGDGIAQCAGLGGRFGRFNNGSAAAELLEKGGVVVRLLRWCRGDGGLM